MDDDRLPAVNEELLDDEPLDEDDYEEISSEEVDRVVEALEALRATVESENIAYYLEQATSDIYSLIYEDDSEEADEDAAADLPHDEAA